MPDSTIGHNRLKSFVQRVERLREEIDALNKDVSEVYKEAKGEGWNVQAIKALIAERSRYARDPEKFRELNDFVDLYRSALESGTVVATRARVNLNSNPHTSTPEATVKGEADGTLPRIASSAVEISTQHPNPATSSPPETGGDAASSSLASSPTNSDDFDPVRDMPAHLRR